MSAHIAKEEMALLMPNSLTHYFKDEPEYLVVPEPAGTSLFSRIGAAVRWVINLPARRSVMDELGSLSDHELADIGLSRSELTRVFDADFAAERGRLAARRSAGM
jgi:uncharacterized protein YjiS (DUF1127 family)